MKVLFDTNVIIDILKHDNDHFLDSLAAYDLCTFKRWDICIAATQVPDLEYLFLARNITGRDTISQYMHHILECFDIVDVAKCDCVLALADQMENTPENSCSFISIWNNSPLCIPQARRTPNIISLDLMDIIQ